MTYRELKTTLLFITEDELDQDVTVYVKDSDEFYGVAELKITTEADVLDEGHLYLDFGDTVKFK